MERFEENTTQVPPEMRRQVFERDGYTCIYCGVRPQRIICEHKIPRCKGGQNTFDNLAASCYGCNAAKGNKSVAEFLAYREAREHRKETIIKAIENLDEISVKAAA